MARPSKTAPIDYKGPNDLTHGLLDRAACPNGLPFVLVRDADKKGLRLRVTRAGGKHWQFETRIKGKLFTRALGEWPAVSIDDAKTEEVTRPITVTSLPTGRVKLEIAGVVMDLSPREAREIGFSMVGFTF
jgi:hypothetical protein